MKTSKRVSQKQERSVAKSFNARPTLASGAIWSQKGDVRNEKYLIECKTTEKDYYTITASVWEKIAKEAVRDHTRIPLLVVDLKNDTRFIIFRPEDFSTALKQPVDVMGVHLPRKSYRLKLDELDELKSLRREYVYGKTFSICGDMKTLLCYMREQDFFDNYGEEVFE